MISTFQRGKCSSGKTVLLSAMAEFFSFANVSKNKYYLSMQNPAEFTILLENMQGIRKGTFPDGNKPNTLREFNFKVMVRENNVNVPIPELNFIIHDYAGGDIYSSIDDMQGKLQDLFNKADQKIFVIDGLFLLHDLGVISKSDSTNFGKLDINAKVNTIDEIPFYLGNFEGVKPPIAFVISKWDYVKKHIDFENLLSILFEKCPSLKKDAPPESIILPISAVGDNNTQDEIIEEKQFINGKERKISKLISIPREDFHFNPENVDVLLAFMFKRFIKNEVKKIDEDYAKNKKIIESSNNLSELKERIDQLSVRTGNISGFKKLLGNILSFWESKSLKPTDAQLKEAKNALNNEILRLSLAIQNEEAKKIGDSRRIRFLSFLELMNDIFSRFTNRYSDAYIKDTGH